MSFEPKRQRQRGYTAHQFVYAWRCWREEMRGKVPEMVVVSVIALVAGLWGGTQGIVEGGILGGLIGSVIGAIGGPLLLTVSLFLWKLFAAPTAIYRQQEDRITEAKRANIVLREQALANWETVLSVRVKMEFDEKSRKGGELVELGTARLEEFEAEIQAGDFSRAAEILAHREPLLAVFSGVSGTASGSYRARFTRLLSLLVKIEAHQAEMARDKKTDL